MSEQVSLWQAQQQTPMFAELCNALYERELLQLAKNDNLSAQSIQGRIKSLPHYIKRVALLMTSIDSPLNIDCQNATWSAKQAKKAPLTQQEDELIWSWYFYKPIPYGLVVPVASQGRIILDCVDKVDMESQRLRTNVFGWFYAPQSEKNSQPQVKLLKPNKRVMQAACAGHCWHSASQLHPVTLSLRELLLSCDINWRNFKQPQAHDMFA